MKLLRYGAPGAERPGLIADDGTIRDLSAHVTDLNGAAISPNALANLAALDPSSLPEVKPDRIGPPVAAPGKIVAIGLNYTDHAKEANLPIPTEPVVFSKAVTSLSGPEDDVILPEGSTRGDWEVELAIVIGTAARHVSRETALNHVAGYAVANDVSEREWQIERGGTWDKGKGFDTFLPLGPWLVTADEVGDPQALDLSLDVNGTRMQTGSTATMIFDCAEIIAYVSRCMTLLPGDVIITGTPPGVGMGIKPDPIYLKDGDMMELEIAGLGCQRQKVHAFDLARLPVLS